MKNLLLILTLFATRPAFATEMPVKNLPPKVLSLLQSQMSYSGQAACDLSGVADAPATVDSIGGATVYLVPCQLGADVEDYRVFALNPAATVVQQLFFVSQVGKGLSGTDSLLNISYDANRKILSSFYKLGCEGEAADYQLSLVNGALTATTLRIRQKTKCENQNPWPTVFQSNAR